MTSGGPVGILLIDDNTLAGDSLGRWALRQPGRVRWLGFTSDCAAAPALVAERQPDAVLLDIDIPGVDTFALVERLLAIRPTLRVLMFSGHVRREYIDRSAEAGAMGYIVKDESPKDIVALVERAVAGEFVLSRTVQGLIRHRAESAGNPAPAQRPMFIPR